MRFAHINVQAVSDWTVLHDARSLIGNQAVQPIGIQPEHNRRDGRYVEQKRVKKDYFGGFRQGTSLEGTSQACRDKVLFPCIIQMQGILQNVMIYDDSCRLE